MLIIVLNKIIKNTNLKNMNENVYGANFNFKSVDHPFFFLFDLVDQI